MSGAREGLDRSEGELVEEDVQAEQKAKGQDLLKS